MAVLVPACTFFYSLNISINLCGAGACVINVDIRIINISRRLLLVRVQHWFAGAVLVVVQ